MAWPASGQLHGRDPNGGYARRRLGGSASDVGSIPTASTIAGPSAKSVRNGRFAEGLRFAPFSSIVALRIVVTADSDLPLVVREVGFADSGMD